MNGFVSRPDGGRINRALVRIRILIADGAKAAMLVEGTETEGQINIGHALIDVRVGMPNAP